MEEAAIAGRVAERLGGRLLSRGSFRSQHHVTVRPSDLLELLALLREDPELSFDLLVDVGGVDWQGFPGRDDGAHRFEVVYQLMSSAHGHRFRVKVAVRDEGEQVPSVWRTWRVANWMEREVFDMFGIRFSGHPNLRRILCHDDFQGHALRKDYPIKRRQELARPVELLLTDDPEWA